MSNQPYQRVAKPQQSEDIQKNEIRVTSQGPTRKYISYAVALLDPSLATQAENEENEAENQAPPEQYDQIVLKALGKAISKTVTIAEVVKRRVPNLHQITDIESAEISYQYQPLEEGLEPVTKQRNVSSITITLSTTPLDTNHPGYQAPIDPALVGPPEASVQRPRPANQRRGRGRGRGRGFRGGRGRGRGGRGRGGPGGRGRGRGFRGGAGGGGLRGNPGGRGMRGGRGRGRGPRGGRGRGMRGAGPR